MVFGIEAGILGISQFSDLVGVLSLVAAVQPRAEYELLFASRSRAAAVLSPDVAFDRPHAHEIVPASDREAGDVHFVDEARAIFIGPIRVIGGVREPLGEQLPIFPWIAADGVQGLKALRSRRSANSVAFLKQAESCIDHVLTDQMRRLSHREKILREARLRAAERPDLSGRPRLPGQPLDRVVSVL